MTTLTVFFEPPIVVRPGGKKTGTQGNGENGKGDLGLPHHSIVRKVHRGFHEDHGDHTHSDRRAERFLGTHLLPKYDGFKNHAGHDSRDHGRDPNQGPKLTGNSSRGMVLLKKIDRPQIAYGATEKAKEGVLGGAQKRHRKLSPRPRGGIARPRIGRSRIRFY